MWKYNRGEWSEAYVFLKLLADGKMFLQNKDGERTDSSCSIKSVVHNEKDGALFEFVRVDNSVKCMRNNSCYNTIPYSVFSEMAAVCADGIINKQIKEKAFPITPIENFYTNELDLSTIKSPGENKDDIVLKIIDSVDNTHFMEGFSIKSKFGSAATLFNFSKASNIVYTIKKCTEEEKNKINSFINAGHKDVKSRIQYILNSDRLSLSAQNSRMVNGSYGDIKTNGSFFMWNLDILDYRIIFVLAEMLKKVYVPKSITDIEELTNLLAKENPLQIENNLIKTPAAYDFYTMKMRQFLFAAFCGLTASKKWSGKQKVNGGYIEVQKNGSILYQKALSDESFTDYLIKNTKFDTPSSKSEKGDFGDVYFNDEYNSYCIDLNFQIRFK